MNTAIAPSDLAADAAYQLLLTAASGVKPQVRLLDRVREVTRVRHYSIRTEDTCVQWARRFILFHGKRHPLELGAAEVTAFLS